MSTSLSARCCSSSESSRESPWRRGVLGGGGFVGVWFSFRGGAAPQWIFVQELVRSKESSRFVEGGFSGSGEAQEL